MRKFKYLEMKESYLIYAVLVLSSFSLVYYHQIIGGIAIFLSVYAIYVDYRRKAHIDEFFIKEIEEINNSFDEITRGAVFAVPFPLVILNEMGKVIWYNSKFKRLIGLEGDAFDHQIQSLLSGLSLEEVLQAKVVELPIGDKEYRFYINRFDRPQGEFKQAILLYGVEVTEIRTLVDQLDNNRSAMIELSIDNYEEVRSSADDNRRALIFAEIDTMINEYASQHGAYVRRYEQDKYLIILEKLALEQMAADNFSILDKVREAEVGNTIPVTISAGASFEGGTPLELHREARSALEIALGRGGDQVVLKKEDDLEYFGGKNQARASRNKVKARVISHAIANYIDQSSQVLIMGHQNPDMDSIGAALGMYQMASNAGKQAYIILNEVSPAIENVYRALEKDLGEIMDHIIDSARALEIYDPSTLVVIVDNHRKSSAETPELLDITDRVVLIDHHRRGSDYIKNTSLTYLEPHASSTAEMVTELLYYQSEKLDLPEIIADALLAGITVDTKNFFYQTGVRTFEAASILKRQGADGIRVKQLFKDDAQTMILKAKVISQMETFNTNIAIGVLKDQVDESVLIAAQAADEMLNILGIEASFVLTQAKGKTHISGRSLGKISVQLILERLGGGGHFTAAGTQMEVSIEDSIELLKKAILEYTEEENDEVYID